MSTTTDTIQQFIADAVRMAVRDELGKATSTVNRLRSVEETAEYLNLSKREIYNMIATGELPVVSHGRRKMLDVKDLDRWIEMNKLIC